MTALKLEWFLNASYYHLLLLHVSKLSQIFLLKDGLAVPVRKSSRFGFRKQAKKGNGIRANGANAPHPKTILSSKLLRGRSNAEAHFLYASIIEICNQSSLHTCRINPTKDVNISSESFFHNSLEKDSQPRTLIAAHIMSSQQPKLKKRIRVKPIPAIAKPLDQLSKAVSPTMAEHKKLEEAFASIEIDDQVFRVVEIRATGDVILDVKFHATLECEKSIEGGDRALFVSKMGTISFTTRPTWGWSCERLVFLKGSFAAPDLYLAFQLFPDIAITNSIVLFRR